jgi:hypothetical protein
VWIGALARFERRESNYLATLTVIATM